MDEKLQRAMEHTFATAKEDLESAGSVPAILIFFGGPPCLQGGIVEMSEAKSKPAALEMWVPKLRAAGYTGFAFLAEAWMLALETEGATEEEIDRVAKEWAGRVHEHPDKQTCITLYLVTPDETTIWEAVYESTAAGYVQVSERKEQPSELRGGIVNALTKGR